MSKLQLNENINYKAFPEEGTGRYIELMPKLIAEGRTPLSVLGLMKRRLEARNASEEVKDSWLYNYFDTGDGIAYHPDGRAKIVLDAQQLRELTPESKLSNGALILPDGMYEELEGIELSKSDLEKYASGNWLKQKEARSNPIWNALARDKNLLEEYASLAFSQGYDKAMAVYRISPQDMPTMRSWCVGGLGGYGWSGAVVRGRLDGDCVRLVGVAPKAQGAGFAQNAVATRPTLDQILIVTGKYVAEVNQDELRKDLGKLYE